jgi:hypothetical protein
MAMSIIMYVGINDLGMEISGIIPRDPTAIQTAYSIH